MVAVQVVSVNFVLPSQGLLFCPHNVLVVKVLGSCLLLAALTDTETAVIFLLTALMPFSCFDSCLKAFLILV